ncbi:MAG TPA: TIGR00366 family protein, partial [Saprospiraceae bacterium]|nr:TIGR00366 family protein [Saprospiraceae bacterium]
IGTAHRIANLPLFSGAEYRSLICFIGLALLAFYNVRYFDKILSRPELSLGKDLSKDSFKINKPLEAYTLSNRDVILLILFLGMVGLMLYGVFTYHWFLNELSAVFCGFAFITALFLWNDKVNIGQKILDSVAEVAPGAFMVGLAASIKVIMEKGAINDTIAYSLSELLKGLPNQFAGVGMLFMQAIINFIIPSGSGQALATMPILLPVGDVLGLTKQTVTLAFQCGDGITNLINPTLGGIVAMTAICGVPFDRWLKFIFPLFILLFLVGIIFVFISVIINYGPA